MLLLFTIAQARLLRGYINDVSIVWTVLWFIGDILHGIIHLGWPQGTPSFQAQFVVRSCSLATRSYLRRRSAIRPPSVGSFCWGTVFPNVELRSCIWWVRVGVRLNDREALNLPYMFCIYPSDLNGASCAQWRRQYWWCFSPKSSFEERHSWAQGSSSCGLGQEQWLGRVRAWEALV